MNRFLKHWHRTGRGEAFRAHVISYADDFVILSRGHADEALWTKAVMTKLGLTLNEAKTSVKDARHERFDFLGYSLGPHYFPDGGRWYLGASPSKKSVQRVKTKVSELLTPGNKGAWPEVRARLIPRSTDQNLRVQSRRPSDMIRQGCSTSLFQASEQWSTISS